MRRLLRKLSRTDNNSSLVRAAVVAALGSGILYSDTAVDSNSRFHVSLSLLTKGDFLELPWRVPLFSTGSLMPAAGNNPYPVHFSRVAPAPAPAVDSNNQTSTDGTTHCTRCFTRDTIADAAAKVSPAVVNLSVPQGIYGLAMGKSIGSGTIIDPNGTILTCAHVVVDFQGMRASSKGKS